MPKLVVHYNLTEAARARILVETGQSYGHQGQAEFDLAEMSQEQRALVVGYAGLPDYREVLDLHIWTYTYHLSTSGTEAETSSNTLALDGIPDLPATLVHIQRMEREKAAAADHLPELLAKQAEYKAQQAERERLLEEKWEQDQAAAEAAKAEAAAKRQAEVETRLAWARAHGSDHLRRCLEIGHTCSRLYSTERAEIEFSGYFLDYDNKAAWKDRACPTVAALDEREAVLAAHPDLDAEHLLIVWQTEPGKNSTGSELDDYDEFAECETVVVRGFLGKYDLLKAI